ncbi:ABC transporter permease/M1 family aminopeptidase [Ferrimonas pelagia]|uniref:M1 family aminopeptidase n=1 Tax=Ferrimonas pelagia TaxID=1177826 RepID=A0ABP9EXF1_9GAMM
MLSKMIAFEWRYFTRQPSFYITYLMFFLLAFFALASDNVQIGAGGNIHGNSPYAIAQILSTLGIFAMFVVVNFVGTTATRNHAHQMEELLYTKPLIPWQYQLGRFLGSYLVVLVVLSSIPLGILIGSAMPWLDPERLGSTVFSHYVTSFAVLTLPTAFVLSALFFTMAVRFRSMMALYLIAVALLVLYMTTGDLASQPQYRTLAALIDPFGHRALGDVTRYWTSADKNTLQVGFEGLLAYNRLLWLALSTLVLLAFASVFRAPALLSRKARGKVAKVIDVPEFSLSQLQPAAGQPSTARQLWLRTRFEISQVVKTPGFIVLSLLTVALLIMPLLDPRGIYGAANLPLTQSMIDNIFGGTGVMMIIIVSYYVAEIVWRERNGGMGDIIDSLPVANFVFWSAKVLAVSLLVALLFVVGSLTTLIYQLLSGFDQLELSQYAIRLAYFAWLPVVYSAILAFFLQAISPNKFVGLGLFVLYFITTFVLASWGFEHSLWHFSESPFVAYSDMNGYGWSLQAHSWYMAYWGGLSLVLFALGFGLYQRGPMQPLKQRIAQLGYQLGGVGKGAIAVGLALFIGCGSYIGYQTMGVHDYVNSDQRKDLQQRYEEAYRQFEDAPILTIDSVKLDAAIYPSQRMIVASAEFSAHNPGNEPVEKLLVQLPQFSPKAEVLMDGATLIMDDPQLNTAWLTFDVPVQPGERREGRFEVIRHSQGLRQGDQDVALVQNGTFINNADLFPLFGYLSHQELTDKHERRKREMSDTRRAHPLEDNHRYTESFLGRGVEFIDFEARLSTEADQIAIAPGYLEKQWVEGDRAHFHYKMDQPMFHFYSIQSARYAVEKEIHNGVSYEVYYHPAHHWNVARMLEAAKDSVALFSKEFGPYQHKQLRIIEFPGYRSFAQSFANTVPYSEKIGFISDLSDPDKIDPVYYVTAHEVAHQWWGHQAGAANVQGSAVISESLSQYAALLVMEQKYGAQRLRSFLKYELDEYLQSRGHEALEEMPLMRAESQSYIHYQKGSLVMMALKDQIGAERLNANLAAFLQRYHFRNDPYPTTLDLMAYLKQDISADEQRFVDDQFSKISLYDLRAKTAQVEQQPDGQFKVTLTVLASQFEADGQGVETELPLAQSIDIGLFSADPDKLSDAAEPLYLQKHQLVSGENTIELLVPEKPAFAGVDPLVRLIDRDAADNVIKL